MKKKLLWTWIPFVLIIAVVGLIFYGNNKEDWKYSEKRKYLSAEECYDENWNRATNFEFDE